VAALVEVVQRRASTGVTTYLVFVDLPKAYGMAPHEALFGKVYQLGAGGGGCWSLSRPCTLLPRQQRRWDGAPLVHSLYLGD